MKYIMIRNCFIVFYQWVNYYYVIIGEVQFFYQGCVLVVCFYGVEYGGKYFVFFFVGLDEDIQEFFGFYLVCVGLYYYDIFFILGSKNFSFYYCINKIFYVDFIFQILLVFL